MADGRPPPSSDRRGARSSRRQALERLYAALETYERLYQFRDPNNACLFDLRVNECYTLELIAERGPFGVKDVAAALGIHKSNASRIAQALHKKGFVALKRDERDGRGVRLQASAKGRKHYQSLRAYLVGRFENTLRQFSADDIATVAKALAILAEDAERRMREARR